VFTEDTEENPIMAMAHPDERNPLRMSEAEYLEFEEKSEIRHEFVNGNV